MSGVGSKIAQTVSQAAATTNARGGNALKKGAKRDPELYVLLGIMSSIFGIAGYYFAGKPTTATDQKSVSMAPGSMPWQSDGSKGDQARANYKYKYHPGGDPRAEQKEAPSALHSVVVPNVTLPKSLHDQFNKWGKDDY